MTFLATLTVLAVLAVFVPVAIADYRRGVRPLHRLHADDTLRAEHDRSTP